MLNIRYFASLSLIIGALIQDVNAQQITLINSHPSDPTAFTQGLEYLQEGKLLLATGLYGQSKIGIIDLKTGKYKVKETLPDHFFGEGITQTPYGIWQLTWKENNAFLRQKDTFHILKTAHYTGEGWGLAYHPEQDNIYMSDGSSRLQRRHAKTFELISTLDVTYLGQPIHYINELEFANGYLYANIWQTHFIVKISPDTGKVVTVYDFSQILQTHFTDEQRQKMDVLNGIAHIQDNRFYITGKFYPVIFEVILE